MDGNPSCFKGPRHPVNSVSWDDCQAFISKLNQKFAASGDTFSLPTEAQWEYACRAGSTSRFCFGDHEDRDSGSMPGIAGTRVGRAPGGREGTERLGAI